MSARQIMIVGFALIIVLMVAIDLVARRQGRRTAPLGTALTAAMRTGTGRVIVLGVWLWMGWHFLAR